MFKNWKPPQRCVKGKRAVPLSRCPSAMFVYANSLGSKRKSFRYRLRNIHRKRPPHATSAGIGACAAAAPASTSNYNCNSNSESRPVWPARAATVCTSINEPVAPCVNLSPAKSGEQRAESRALRECSCPRGEWMLQLARSNDLKCGTWTWPACQSSKSFWRHWNSLRFHMTVHTCHNQSHRAAIIMHQLSSKLGACEHSLLPRPDLSKCESIYLHMCVCVCVLVCLYWWTWLWASMSAAWETDLILKLILILNIRLQQLQQPWIKSLAHAHYFL